MKTKEQYKIAKWLGIAPSTLSNYFCDNRCPKDKIALELEEKSGIQYVDWKLLDRALLRKKVFDAYRKSKESVNGGQDVQQEQNR